MSNRQLERWIEQKLRLRHLELVVEVYDCRSIVKASKRLNLTQPAVTKALQEIESTLDLELFERTNRGVNPTVYGDLFAQHAKTILAQMHQAVEDIEDHRAGYTGHVVVGTSIAASVKLLPDAIVLYKGKRPRVTVTVVDGTYDMLLPALRVGDLDVVLGRLPETRQEPDFTYETLYLEPTCLIVRRNHPLVKKKSLALKDLIEHPWLMPVRETALRQQIESLFAAARTQLPKNIIESVSILTNREILRKSDAIGVMPHHVISDDVENRLLSILPVDINAATRPVGIILSSNGSLSPVSRVFLDCVRAVGKTISTYDRLESVSKSHVAAQ